MTQLITPAELEGLNEQELRGLYGRIMSELTSQGRSAQDYPLIFATLRNIEGAIARLRQRRPKPPGF
jgi:hypothetical protein